MKSRTIGTALAERYATALFDLARADDQLDAVRTNLQRFVALFEESADLRYFAALAGIIAETKVGVVKTIVEKLALDPLTLHFLLLITRNRRLTALVAIAAAFERRCARFRGEQQISVYSATPLTDETLQQLQTTLPRGATIHNHIDPALLGGVAIQSGSTLIDASLRARLTSLQRALQNAPS